MDVETVLSNTPVLRLFGEHKELALQCDAFELVLRACLFQEGHPIMYASRSLTETKKPIMIKSTGASLSWLCYGKI